MYGATQIDSMYGADQISGRLPARKNKKAALI